MELSIRDPRLPPLLALAAVLVSFTSRDVVLTLLSLASLPLSLLVSYVLRQWGVESD